MISYQEALSIIKNHPFELKAIEIDISESTNRILAEDIIADRDLPPYDRVTMDGIAINYDAYEKGSRTFEVIETIGAGVPQKTITEAEKCVQIMTGAIMPKGLDTVIRYEDIEIDEGKATIQVESVKRAQNIHFRAEDRNQGEVVLQKGTRLSPADLIVISAVGKRKIKVYELPKAAIITTGDELVDIDEQPLEHQVRRSSNYGVESLLKGWGMTSQQHHINDNKELLINKVSYLIESNDALVLTGGVSRGKFDYLPEVLEEIGVVKHFHKVKQRPGKPFWFGTTPTGKTIFALPGNPVSSFACANVYIKQWLDSSLKQENKTMLVKLANEVHFKPPLTYFLECKVSSNEKGELIAETFKGNGSGDFANLTIADGFLILPDDRELFKQGEVYPFIAFRN